MAGRGHGAQPDGSKQMTAEATRGHVDAVHLYAGAIGVAAQRDRLGLRARELHLVEVAQGVGHGLLAVAERVLHLVGRPVGRLAVLSHCRCHGVGQLVDDLRAAAGLEHAATHEAVGVDELAAELLVLQQLAEDGDERDVGNDDFSAGQQRVEVVLIFHVHDVVEHVAAAVEGSIGVEHHETEATAVLMAEGLHVVAQPVVAAQEELGSHVVDILVDVQNLANLVVGSGIG